MPVKLQCESQVNRVLYNFWSLKDFGRCLCLYPISLENRLIHKKITSLSACLLYFLFEMYSMDFYALRFIFLSN